MPLPGELIPEPDTDDNPPLFGSGFNFLNAPSAMIMNNFFWGIREDK